MMPIPFWQVNDSHSHQVTSLCMLTLEEHRYSLMPACRLRTVSRGTDINLQDFPKLIPSWLRLKPGFRPLRRILQRGEQGERFPSTLITQALPRQCSSLQRYCSSKMPSFLVLISCSYELSFKLLPSSVSFVHPSERAPQSMLHRKKDPKEPIGPRK